MPPRTRVGVLLFAFGCLVCSGCVTKTVGDSGSMYHYEWWAPVTTFFAGMFALPIGFVLRTTIVRLGWGLMIIGPMAAIGFAPSMYLERVLVHEKGFTVHSGIWGMTANEDVAFDAIRAVRIAQEKTGGRRSRWIDVLYFDKKTGDAVRLPLNNGVKEEAAKEIVQRAVESGVTPVGFQ